MNNNNNILINSIDDDIFLLKGFSELVNCYQAQKDTIEPDKRENIEFFINSYLENISTKLYSALNEIK